MGRFLTLPARLRERIADSSVSPCRPNIQSGDIPEGVSRDPPMGFRSRCGNRKLLGRDQFADPSEGAFVAVHGLTYSDARRSIP